MNQKILITGGIKSGKSIFAEKITLSFGKKSTYIATAEIIDKEMRERIAIHKKRRKDEWYEYESSIDLISTLNKVKSDSPILIDCITLWINNLFYKKKDWKTEVKKFSNFLLNYNQPIVIVTNEVGSGLISMHKLSRRFQDANGTTNQILAAVCDEVYVVTSGIPVKIKGN